MPKQNTADEFASLRRAVKRKCVLTRICDGGSLVWGSGPSTCALLVIGEAPGRDETRAGMPFVGRAGKFLVSVLVDVLGTPREDIYITNVVKTWPVIATKRGRTRKPSKEELDFFTPYLEREVSIVKPRVILAVGKTAYHALVPAGEFRPGSWSEYKGIPLMAVYHPAYILRKGKSLKENTALLKKSIGDVRKKLKSVR